MALVEKRPRQSLEAEEFILPLLAKSLKMRGFSSQELDFPPGSSSTTTPIPSTRSSIQTPDRPGPALTGCSTPAASGVQRPPAHCHRVGAAIDAF
jgi:hypothetical protein